MTYEYPGSTVLLTTPSPMGEGRRQARMQSDKKQILNRLATIEGHVKGIRKMVEEDQYCVDIVKQSYAVERALKACSRAIWRRVCRPASRKVVRTR